MPARSFQCGEHGNFRRVVPKKVDEASCPDCGTRCHVLDSPRVGASIASSILDNSPILSEEALNERISLQIKEAWAESKKNHARRKAAEVNLTEEQKARREENLELRKNLQDIILSEDPRDIEAAGFGVWKRSDRLSEQTEGKLNS